MARERFPGFAALAVPSNSMMPWPEACYERRNEQAVDPVGQFPATRTSVVREAGSHAAAFEQAPRLPPDSSAARQVRGPGAARRHPADAQRPHVAPPLPSVTTFGRSKKDCRIGVTRAEMHAGSCLRTIAAASTNSHALFPQQSAHHQDRCGSLSSRIGWRTEIRRIDARARIRWLRPSSTKARRRNSLRSSDFGR